MPSFTVRGLDAIKNERVRQLTKLGYTQEGDAGRAREIARAGACYADYAATQLDGYADETYGDLPHPFWPWAADTWKPEPSALENMAKAGALLAAAYDSLWAELNG